MDPKVVAAKFGLRFGYTHSSGNESLLINLRVAPQHGCGKCGLQHVGSQCLVQSPKVAKGLLERLLLLDSLPKQAKKLVELLSSIHARTVDEEVNQSPRFRVEERAIVGWRKT